MVGGTGVSVGVPVDVSVGFGVEVGGSNGGGKVGGNGSVAVFTGVGVFIVVGTGGSTTLVDRLQLNVTAAIMTMPINFFFSPVIFLSPLY